MEIYKQRSYATVRGFIRAARHYMAAATGDYPEDALTGHYASGESMEVALRRDGSYYYEDNCFNIDIEMETHMYIHVKD